MNVSNAAMIKSSALFLVGFVPYLIMSSGSKWTETKNKNDIVTYIGTANETGLKPTLSVMNVSQTPDETLTAILDFDSYHHWVPYCENSHTVEKVADSLYYFYQLLDMPVIKNRDIIIKVEISKKDIEGYLIKMTSVPDYIELDPDAIRIGLFKASYSIAVNKGSGKTVVSMENEVDPGGYIPTFALNWASRTQPHQTFSNLKEHIANYGSKR